MSAQGIDTDHQTIEPMLEQLIKQHGAEQVRAGLEVLFGKSRFSDYQRVFNAIRNISNRLERQKEKAA